MELEQLEPSEAAAELYVRSLRSLGTIDTAWRKDDSNVVCATTHGDGPHLMNHARDYDTDVHLICEADGVDDAGNLPEPFGRGSHGDIFFNVVVHGIADDPTGYALPTHTSEKHGAFPRASIDPSLRALAERAGVDLDG